METELVACGALCSDTGKCGEEKGACQSFVRRQLFGNSDLRGVEALLLASGMGRRSIHGRRTV